MILRISTLMFILLAFRGCASLTTPSGGPKDLKPPRLLISNPRINQTNFKGKAIELTFNEPVKLNNPKEEIIISPTPGKNVEFKVKGNKVIITTAKPWQDSTTYSIQFREGVQDVTEGNSPNNLKIAFSTGPEIDTLSLNGKVKDLLRGTIAERVMVGLYAPDTFNIFTDTAMYFTKTDKKGKFKIENIKSGTYRIYAFDDKNKNLRVESQTERFAFQVESLVMRKNIDSLEIGLVMIDSRPLKISSIRNLGKTTLLRFNKYITHYTIDRDSGLIHAFGDNQTEVAFWNPPERSDSVKINIIASDSVQNNVDSTFYIKHVPTKPSKSPFNLSLGTPIVESENGKLRTTLTFNKPITNFDFDSLLIRIDTTITIPITRQDLTIESTIRHIILSKQLDPKLFKAEKDPILTLVAGKGFAYSIDQDTSKAQTTPIPILWPEDTGIVHIQTDTKEKTYIIQLLDRSGKQVNFVRNITKYTFKNLPPGEYQIRIIVDANDNGVWDPGNFFKTQTPERVIFYKTAKNKQVFTMRANWENGPLILKF